MVPRIIMREHLPFLQGGGQLGELIRNRDWSATNLNSPETWPESLRSAVAIALNSGFPIAIYWGTAFTLLYNDAWSSIPGQKHPWSLGRPGGEVWPEIWEGLKEEFESVLHQGQSYRRPDAPLYMHRYGYTEECYFDYSLSPIMAPDGNVGGVFNAVIETSYRVINERRAGIRNAFLAQLTSSTSLAMARQTIFQLLERAVLDISFYAYYSFDTVNEAYELSGSSRLNDLQLAQLSRLLADYDGSNEIHLENLDTTLSTPVISHWPEPVTEAMVLPVHTAEASVKGYIVLGASARKRVDQDYRQFFAATAANTGSILNNAYTAELAVAYQKELMLNAELYEEQQALNEEITASNEELASTNEELVALNEELAATNEELNETQAELHQTLDKLSESEYRFSNLISEASTGIVLLTGPELLVDVVNEAFAGLIGKEEGELLKKPLFEVLSENSAGLRTIVESVLQTNEPVHLYEQYYPLVMDDKPVERFLNIICQPYIEAGEGITGIIVLCQDVTEQVQVRHRAEATERKFQFMLNAIPQQVWTTTPDGQLNYVNQVVTEDFGYPADVVVGNGWQTFIHPDDLPGCLLAWQSALTTGEEYTAEFRLRFADGEYYWHLSRAVPLKEKDEIVLWLGTNTNIEIQKQNEQRKDEFLSIASHELKTPLTGIKAFNQLLRKAANPERAASYVEKAAENIQRLEKLINDLLDVTKINAGKLSYDLQNFNFSEMLREAVETFQLTTSSHEIVLTQPAQVIVNGDRMRLEQVVNNFLSNATKYSPDSDKVVVKSEISGQGLIVSVQDFGIGIEAQHIQRLFDRYYRVDNTKMRFDGLGLGLFISSEILKRHLGTFWIESEPGKGSVFYFRLPLESLELDYQPVIQTDQYYKDPHITILRTEGSDYLEVDWTGFQTVDTVKAGGMRMLEMLKANGVTKVVNDNSHVLGSWSEAADWAGEEWFPMMAEAGLRYFAWVYSPSVFSRLSAEKAVAVKEGAATVQFFTSTEEAIKWLERL